MPIFMDVCSAGDPNKVEGRVSMTAMSQTLTARGTGGKGKLSIHREFSTLHDSLRVATLRTRS